MAICDGDLTDILLTTQLIKVNTVETLKVTYQGWYDNITTTVGCNTAADSLACLRTVPYEKLFSAVNGFQFKPYIDGNFISQPPSVSIAKGQIADVALIMGSNTDEGTAEFFTPRGTLNNDSDISSLVAHLGDGLNESVVANILRLYPDDPIQGCPLAPGPRDLQIRASSISAALPFLAM